ncbi:MAG: hypothetical protein ACI97A_003739 [Planctomycetota bacterium]|jgi:hypothetical protein
MGFLLSAILLLKPSPSNFLTLKEEQQDDAHDYDQETGRALRRWRHRKKNHELALVINAEFMQLGYIMSADLFDRVATLAKDDAKKLYDSVTPVLKNIKGADVVYEPMYPNFPEQVAKTLTLDLYSNALLHYWSFGTWRPNYVKTAREFDFEPTDCTQIEIAKRDDFDTIFAQILGSKDSISQEDKDIVRWFFVNKADVSIPKDIPYKESLCFVVAECLTNGRDFSEFLKTATDVLRVITNLSGGDISLSENTKYKSLPRRQRRMFEKILDRVARAEDLKRHHKKWNKVFHSLHVGEYSSRLFALAKKVRTNCHIDSFNGQVERSIAGRDLLSTLNLVASRPGEFARTLDHLLRVFDSSPKVIDGFKEVVDQVPTRILLQLLGNLNTRFADCFKKVIFPKGQTQKAQLVMKKTERL